MSSKHKVSTTMQQLNHQITFPSNHTNATPCLVFLHGLFGDMHNLNIIAHHFETDYPVLKVDLRNHGQSFHHDEMDYTLMAQDVITLCEQLKLDKLILIGHSMGGKTALRITSLIPEKIDKLVVLDIAPTRYHAHHNDIFQALFAVKQAQPQSRQEAKPILNQYIKEEGIQQFMLKSFSAKHKDAFLFNLTALYQNYDKLMDWQPIKIEQPVLFIKGGQSDYIQDKHRTEIQQQCPNATAFIIANAAHWVHVDNPQSVIRAIDKFL